VWEHLNFFSVGNRHVLAFCPMDVKRAKTVYLVGDMNYQTGKFSWERQGEIDLGFDFYGARFFSGGSQGIVCMGWLNSWEWMPWFKSFGPTAVSKWCGALSIPRSVELGTDGLLRFHPLERLETLRTQHLHLRDTLITPSGKVLPEEIGGVSLEIILELDLSSCNATQFGLKVRWSRDLQEETVISYEKESSTVRLDRRKSDPYSDGINECKVEASPETRLTLRIFVDTCSVEVFVNDGRAVASNNIYPHPGSTGLELFSVGGDARVLSLDVWRLKSIWDGPDAG